MRWAVRWSPVSWVRYQASSSRSKSALVGKRVPDSWRASKACSTKTGVPGQRLSAASAKAWPGLGKPGPA